MKVLVVSGFLGAGKTTFIQMLMRRTNQEIAILENEYAAVGMDGELLKNSVPSEKINIWESTEGCICCSSKGDFAASVLTIANAVNPECLIVEPTGVGMLSNVISSLKQIEYERITLLAPITIVDGNRYFQHLLSYPELYSDQILAASSILVSKMERADARERERVARDLREKSPQADIVAEHYSVMGQEWWERLLETRLDKRCMALPQKAQDEQWFDTLSLEGVSFAAPEQLILFMEQLLRGQFGDVVRAKGCVRAGGIPFRFDMADQAYSITGAEGFAGSRAVLIGRNLQKQRIRNCFLKKKSQLLKKTSVLLETSERM